MTTVNLSGSFTWGQLSSLGISLVSNSLSIDSDEKRHDWREDAICNQVDPEIWFPEKGGSTREAKKICNRCPVRDKCLSYALRNDERFGIWGGKSERERRKIKPLRPGPFKP